jgi:ligand-binding sensor domain-containing protein/serine phosphatase RsbU (regulator of sigma subunit)
MTLPTFYKSLSPPVRAQSLLRRFLYLTLLVLPLHLPLHTQDLRLRFRTLSLADGLSQSTVNCIMQDRKGFMWFGTVDGLNRYDGYRFKIYKTEPDNPRGLRNSMIRALLEDRNGMIWVGTEGGGAYRFDPALETFTSFHQDRTDSTSLSNDYVWSICEDRTGVLWIGTQEGLNRLKPDGRTFARYMVRRDDPGGLSGDYVSALCEDSAGNVWVGTQGGGISRFDRVTGQFHTLRFSWGDPLSLSSDFVTSALCDRFGRVWIGTADGGVNVFDPATGTVTRFRHNSQDPSSLSDDRVLSLWEDREGTVWIGTNGGGLNRFAPPSSFIRYRNDPQNPQSLSNNLVWSIRDDRTGGLWVGTEFGGVCLADRYSTKFDLYARNPLNPNSLNDGSVWSIREDRSGILWVGTRVGGLNRFDRRKGTVTHYMVNPENPLSLGHNHIRSIYEDRGGTLWVGTDGGGLARCVRGGPENLPLRFERYTYDPSDPASLSGNRVYTVFEDRTGTLWIGTRTGGLNRMDRERQRFVRYQHDPDDSSGISDNFVYCLYEDRGGTLWVGTFGGGLNRMLPPAADEGKERFVTYRNDPDDPRSLSNSTVLAVLEDRAGRLWIGTGGGGLNRMVPPSGRDSAATFVRYTEERGLSNNFVYGILEDEHGKLWLSTNFGVARFDPETGSFQNYDVRDGLQSNEFNGGAYEKNRAGEMFFGGINGFNAFFPERVSDNPNVPAVYISDFLVFNEPIRPGEDSPLTRDITETKRIVLTHDQNVFSLGFVALNFSMPDKNRYRFMMEGIDRGWIETDARHRLATYMNLSPGSYVFKVRGSNNDGVWGVEGASVTVEVRPPYWASWWFRASAFLAVGALAYTLYGRRLRTVRMKTELVAAHKAQMSIMPQADPEVPGFDISGSCIPANEVGGDFFDYFWMDEDRSRFGIVVGDVSGKAMESAMTAVLTSGLIAAKVGEGLEIRDFMTSLNRPLFTKTRRSVFTALCLAALDIRSKVLHFTNAGLVKPFLVRGSDVSQLEAAGTNHPLGLLPNTCYQENDLNLESGDVLVFVTDGITDEQNRSGEFFGEESLARLLKEGGIGSLPAKEIKERILEGVKKFTGPATQDDDMTVVVVRTL